MRPAGGFAVQHRALAHGEVEERDEEGDEHAADPAEERREQHAEQAVGGGEQRVGDQVPAPLARAEHGRGQRDRHGGGQGGRKGDDGQPGGERHTGAQPGQRGAAVAGAGVEHDEQSGDGGQRGNRDRGHQAGVHVVQVDLAGQVRAVLGGVDGHRFVWGTGLGEQDVHRRYRGQQ